MANCNLETLERFASAALSGDAATLKALADPAMLLHQGAGLPYAGTFHGPEGFLEFMGIFGETYDIQHFATVRSFVGDDPDWVAVEFAMRATVRKTGAPFETTLVELWRFQDGKVVEIRPHYFNTP